jgi:hypothetical protein
MKKNLPATQKNSVPCGSVVYADFTAITENVEATRHDDIPGKENKAPCSIGR